MTAENIKKALECCEKDDCDNCPNDFGNCYANLSGYALELINRYEEKIKNLETDLESAHSLGKCFKNLYDREAGKKNTAIQDYAERLHDSINPDWCKIHKLIDDIKEEIMEVYK